jgi:D-glycero-D-manno-heptose 1,7-bisphosphate phosphatase
MELDPEKTKMKRPALFLDRDGTINTDRVYIHDPKLIELIPGSAHAIRKAQEAGYAIVVVTNQSGIARGLIDAKALPNIHARLDELLQAAASASIDLYQICPHAPLDKCQCRKPNPKLVFDAAAALDLDIENSVFIGDKLLDVGTGNNAKCKASILLRTGKGREEEHILKMSHAQLTKADQPSFVADDLAAAVDWFLASSKKRSSKA